jgi:hypothetical protein
LPEIEWFTWVFKAFEDFRGKVFRRDEPVVVTLENGFDSRLEMIALDLV